ncbi:MAG: ribokinase [Defluviitaleaceae bacterium]|nr:ribokinase [Defluviitaleaceae bacterium]
MSRILNIGSINIDYVYSVPHFVRGGETLSAESRQIFPGGKGMNQSVALARSGGSVTHAGMIGDDGKYLLDVLQEAGVDTGLVAIGNEPTGHAIIQVNGEGQNSILLFPGANQNLAPDFIDRVLAPFRKDDILVLQNEVNCVGYAIEAAKAKGMIVVFNPSPFGSEIESYPLEMVDVWLLNEIEGEALTGMTSAGDIVNTMASIYPNAIIVLTLGAEGVLCHSRGNELRIDGIKVQAVDTTAAGDTFTGYFVGCLAQGIDIYEALKLANIAASISVSRVGAAVSIPTWDEVASKVS